MGSLTSNACLRLRGLYWSPYAQCMLALALGVLIFQQTCTRRLGSLASNACVCLRSVHGFPNVQCMLAFEQIVLVPIRPVRACACARCMKSLIVQCMPALALGVWISVRRVYACVCTWCMSSLANLLSVSGNLSARCMLALAPSAWVPLHPVHAYWLYQKNVFAHKSLTNHQFFLCFGQPSKLIRIMR
jgi:hypothetical protein